jgi:glycosyltransferase involved in cell wall biosynthesis
MGTGAGKTVMMPKLMLHYFAYQKKVAITIPRKGITESAGIFGADALDCVLGNEVGYRHGSDKTKASPDTKLLYTTDGTIKAKITSSDPDLNEYHCLIIDEAHERNTNIDILFTLVKNVCKKRPEFKLIIMSATVDTNIFKYDLTSRDTIRKFYGVKEDEILLINIGSMTKNKGMLFILQSLNLLVNKLNLKHYKLLLKGTADLYNSKMFLEIYFEELQQMGAMNKTDMQKLLNDHIIFTDKTLSYKKINDLFNAADLYLSPYLAEGFNLTCLEALSANLPVMVPMTGSTKEYIEDIYNNGGKDYIYYIPSKVINVGNDLHQNDIAMDSLINTLLQNEMNIKKIQSNKIKNEKMSSFIKREYSWSKVAELLFDYFKYIIKNCN